MDVAELLSKVENSMIAAIVLFGLDASGSNRACRAVTIKWGHPEEKGRPRILEARIAPRSPQLPGIQLAGEAAVLAGLPEVGSAPLPASTVLPEPTTDRVRAAMPAVAAEALAAAAAKAASAPSPPGAKARRASASASATCRSSARTSARSLSSGEMRSTMRTRWALRVRKKLQDSHYWMRPSERRLRISRLETVDRS